MDTTVVERTSSFERRFDLSQASSIIELPWGVALLQADFPLSRYHNRVIVDAPVSAAEVVSTTNEILGGAALSHQYVTVSDASLGKQLRDALVDAGFEHEAIATMAYRRQNVNDAEHEVVDVSVETLRPALIRDWRLELPAASDEEITQLADRSRLYSLGADVSFLAVFDGDQIVARADLYVDTEANICQFENLFTHPDHRGRGYGKALVADALTRGRDAGCDLCFLTADAIDWPYHWYQRLGFVEVATSHHFSCPD